MFIGNGGGLNVVAQVVFAGGLACAPRPNAIRDSAEQRAVAGDNPEVFHTGTSMGGCFPLTMRMRRERMSCPGRSPCSSAMRSSSLRTSSGKRMLNVFIAGQLMLQIDLCVNKKFEKNLNVLHCNE